MPTPSGASSRRRRRTTTRPLSATAAGPSRAPARSRSRRIGSGPHRVARPTQPDPGACGTQRPPRPAVRRALLHFWFARGCRGPAGTGLRSLASALWVRERAAPHPGRAVPRGRLPHAPGTRPGRDGHSATVCPEHRAYGSTEFQTECIHWTVAGQNRTPSLDSGRPVLLATLRLPWCFDTLGSDMPPVHAG